MRSPFDCSIHSTREEAGVSEGGVGCEGGWWLVMASAAPSIVRTHAPTASPWALGRRPMQLARRIARARATLRRQVRATSHPRRMHDLTTEPAISARGVSRAVKRRPGSGHARLRASTLAARFPADRDCQATRRSRRPPRYPTRARRPGRQRRSDRGGVPGAVVGAPGPRDAGARAATRTGRSSRARCARDCTNSDR